MEILTPQKPGFILFKLYPFLNAAFHRYAENPPNIFFKKNFLQLPYKSRHIIPEMCLHSNIGRRRENVNENISIEILKAREDGEKKISS